MNWSQFLASAAIAVGAYLAAEAAGKSRGKYSKAFKMLGVALALVAGLALVVAVWPFGWVKNPPTLLAAAAGGYLLLQAVVAVRDLASDGEPDRGCRVAVLALPLLLVLGGAWLMREVPDTVREGGDRVTNSTTTR